MVPISGETREETWFEAIKYLVNHAEEHMEYNLIMEVKNPGRLSEKSKIIASSFDTLLRESGYFPLQTVADTIFPTFEYKKHGKDGVFNVYPDEIYPLIKCANGNKSGTYAYRILRGLGPKGVECRPLENIMKRLKAQIDKSNGIRCAFELSMDDISDHAVETIPINRNDTKLMGFPCLSHLSFKLNRDRSELHLTAIYRSHYYIEKALGNLLGLARLQKFMARELGIKAGTLVCHSTLAKLDHTKTSLTKIKKFIQEVEGATNAG